jgi:outer membrane protein OmpA-like peptidoglycan-associated protein
VKNTPGLMRSSVIALLLQGLSAAANGEALDCSRGNWPEAELRVRGFANESTVSVEQGSEFSVRLSGAEQGHVAIVIQDALGKVRVLIPQRENTSDLLQPGSELVFPDAASGESLIADLNVGQATLCVITTEEPLFREWRSKQSTEAPLLPYSELEPQLNAMTGTRYDRARLVVMVRQPSIKEFVSADEFVEFYTVGTRSVKNADRGFRIGFKLNSAELDEFSRRQLESVGAGMKDQRLAARRFLIEGHTDDLGAPDYNRELSVRRAQAVRDYLARVSGVPRQRLDIRGLGQSKPQVEGATEQARSQNRRVVIRRLDEG